MAAARPKEPKKPRVKREPSELSIAIKSINLLKRKQAAREKFIAKIEALDATIVVLQNAAASSMTAVNEIIYGPEAAASSGV